jgi:hypothetical protein
MNNRTSQGVLALLAMAVVLSSGCSHKEAPSMNYIKPAQETAMKQKAQTDIENDPSMPPGVRAALLEQIKTGRPAGGPPVPAGMPYAPQNGGGYGSNPGARLLGSTK